MAVAPRGGGMLLNTSPSGHYNWIKVSTIFWQTHFIFQQIFEQAKRLFIMNEPSNNYGWESVTAAAGAFVMHQWQLLPHTAHLQSPSIGYTNIQ